MGNITALKRYQAGTLIDSLIYGYTLSGNNTNQLQSVIDNSGSNLGLANGTTGYLYDGNGNMLSASNSINTGGNKSFTYNILNLPTTATFATGSATFAYDAAGNKLRKASTAGSTTTYTDYINGIQYSGTSSESIAFIQTEEGKAVPNGTTNYDYTYYLGDNLGNTRVTFDTKNGYAQSQQVDDYYPFGLEINRTPYTPKNEYLYNKKELQEEFGEYDYGARFYDPVIGRWTTIDPMAEKSRRFSTYGYVSDNPINSIDPDGMTDFTIDKQTGDVKQVGQANKDPDRVLKTDGKGNVKKKGEGFLGFLVRKSEVGKPKVAFGGIEKGILTGGENLKKDDHAISVGGQGQPSVTGVKNFVIGLSEYLDKEIGGYELSNKGQSEISKVFIGGYGANSGSTEAKYGLRLDRVGLDIHDFDIPLDFHTHLSRYPDDRRENPSQADKNSRDENKANGVKNFEIWTTTDTYPYTNTP